MIEKTYTADLSKGQGLIEETAAILRYWQPGMSLQELKDGVLQQGVISKATAIRVNDIVGRIFASRYLSGKAEAAANMKQLVELGVPLKELTQLFFVYAARWHDILHDYVIDVYWAKYSAGASEITKQDALDFIERAKNTGRVSPPWSESTTVRMARYLGTAMLDFGLAGKDHSGCRDMRPFAVSRLTALYLAHEIHFTGVSDSSILDHPDWELFGMDPMDVKHELERVSGGHFIVQFSGDLLRISWKYKTMEEAIRAIVAAEF
ncbi:MAG: BrxA family protein [Kiritimatiellales bacterium]